MFRTEHSAEFLSSHSSQKCSVRNAVDNFVPFGSFFVVTNSSQGFFVRSVPLGAVKVRLFGLHVMKKADQMIR
jgi:hypothetical protein